MNKWDLRRAAELPVIGVTCHVDTGCSDDIFPGRALNYIDRTYSDVLIAHGMIPFLIPINEDAEYVERVLQTVDGLVGTGGGKIPDYVLNQKKIPGLSETAPERYRFEKVLFQKALKYDLPFLGMCRSMQTINEILGGSMYYKISEDIPAALEHNQTKVGLSLEEPYHEIDIVENSHLSRIFGETKMLVNSWHSQSIKEPGRGFKIVARSQDNVVEAIESEVNSFVLMTQFHPEILIKKEAVWNKLFLEFKSRAVQRKKEKFQRN